MNQLLLVCLLWGLSLQAHAVDPKDLLPAGQAFSLIASMPGVATLRAQWTIADGYYMYRKRFGFSTGSADVQLGQALFPVGQIKKDEFLGDVETYRHRVVIEIPISHTPGVKFFSLDTVAQGCADLGVCYPPQKQHVTLTFPTLGSPASTASAETSAPDSPPSLSAGIHPVSVSSVSAGVARFLTGLGANLGARLGLGNNINKFLDPDAAYQASFDVVNGNTLDVHWDIAKDYYLYRDKFAFTLTQADGVRLASAELPAGVEKVDESFGKMEIYHNQVTARLPLLRSNTAGTAVTLLVSYQGCAEAGFCYPPMTKTVNLALPPISAGIAAIPHRVPVPEQEQIAQSLADGRLGVTLLSFFGFGLLLAFTPCVFPMVPILSGIIVGHGASQNSRKALILSLVYVIAMALTYAVMGVIAGRFGENLQAAAQNPWLLVSFSFIFVALAFSMFGFYDLQLPGTLQSRLAAVSDRQRGGTFVGVAAMGVLSAFIVGPCVAAPLAGALIYIGRTGNALLGGLALFALGLGMGAPLIVIGASLGRWLPKAGAWMGPIKAVFGVLLLAVAIVLLERVLPAQVTLILWAVLFIAASVYTGALDRLDADATGWRKLGKGAGVVLLVYGALVLTGAASGGRDVLNPLAAFTSNGQQGAGSPRHLVFKHIRGLAQLQRELVSASVNGNAVMLDFYADWCVSCKEMEKYTFSDAGVVEAANRMVLLQADVTANDAIDQTLLKSLGLIGPPAVLFFGPDGHERMPYRLVGFLSADKFTAHILQASS